MSGVLVLGASGYGKTVATNVLARGLTLLGFLDDNPATWGTTRLGRPVLGGIDTYATYAPDALVLGIGDIRARRKIVERLGAAAHDLWGDAAIHPHAVIGPDVQMGRGMIISPGAVIDADVRLGNHVIVNINTTVSHDCVLGDYVHIAPGAQLGGGVHVGCDAMIAMGAVVTPTCRIGAGAVVAAGAVVLRDVPDGAFVKGIPAR